MIGCTTTTEKEKDMHISHHDLYNPTWKKIGTFVPSPQVDTQQRIRELDKECKGVYIRPTHIEIFMPVGK